MAAASEHLSVMSLPPSVTFTDAVACSHAMRKDILAACTACGRHGTVVIDAGAVRFFDSSALAVLLQCRRDAAAQGCRVAIKHMPEKLRELTHLYGVAELLPDA